MPPGYGPASDAPTSSAQIQARNELIQASKSAGVVSEINCSLGSNVASVDIDERLWEELPYKTKTMLGLALYNKCGGTNMLMIQDNRTGKTIGHYSNYGLTLGD